MYAILLAALLGSLQPPAPPERPDVTVTVLTPSVMVLHSNRWQMMDVWIEFPPRPKVEELPELPDDGPHPNDLPHGRKAKLTQVQWVHPNMPRYSFFVEFDHTFRNAVVKLSTRAKHMILKITLGDPSMLGPRKTIQFHVRPPLRPGKGLR